MAGALTWPIWPGAACYVQSKSLKRVGLSFGRFPIPGCRSDTGQRLWKAKPKATAHDTCQTYVSAARGVRGVVFPSSRYRTAGSGNLTSESPAAGISLSRRLTLAGLAVLPAAVPAVALCEEGGDDLLALEQRINVLDEKANEFDDEIVCLHQRCMGRANKGCESGHAQSFRRGDSKLCVQPTRGRIMPDEWLDSNQDADWDIEMARKLLIEFVGGDPGERLESEEQIWSGTFASTSTRLRQN